jgi:hypothetical protein
MSLVSSFQLLIPNKYSVFQFSISETINCYIENLMKIVNCKLKITYEGGQV